jgi:hypothetical protein
VPRQADFRVAFLQPPEPRHELPGDLVKPGLQLERFIKLVHLPAERIVGREHVLIDGGCAIRLPADPGRRHVFGIGVDAVGARASKTIFAGDQFGPTGATHGEALS